MARSTLKSLLRDDALDLKLWRLVIKCYDFLFLLCVFESCSLKRVHYQKTENYGFMEESSVSCSEQILQRVNFRRGDHHFTIRRGNICWPPSNEENCIFGDLFIVKKYPNSHLILKRKIEGHRGVGSMKTWCLKNLQDWTGVKTIGRLYTLLTNEKRMLQMSDRSLTNTNWFASSLMKLSELL